MPDAPALVTRHDHVMLLTVNRPEARNAINSEVAAIIGDALEQAEHDASIWVVVITGAGEQAFCAGADLKAISRGESLYPAGKEHWSFAGWCNHYISKPTIAAVNGLAFGGGLEIVLASDLVVAAEGARFGLPEVSRGLIAAAGGAFRIIEQLPRKVAMHLLVTGDPIDAATAHRYGLVNELVPDGAALDAAMALAERIARNSPTAVAASKRVAYGVTDATAPATRTWAGEIAKWELIGRETLAVRASADGQEGPRAFTEKRAPIWQGA